MAEKEQKNTLEIELSSLLNTDNHQDNLLSRALKRHNVATVADLKALLLDCLHINPSGRREYLVVGFGKASFARLEQVTRELGVDLYPETPLPQEVKEFVEIARKFVPSDRYYPFLGAIEQKYLKHREK